MLKLFSVIVLAGTVLGQGQRNDPHPCTVTTPFAQDYAACGNYFWCNAAGDAFPTGPCPDGFFFNPTSQTCIQDDTECTECPATVTGIFAVRFKSYFKLSVL